MMSLGRKVCEVCEVCVVCEVCEVYEVYMMMTLLGRIGLKVSTALILGLEESEMVGMTFCFELRQFEACYSAQAVAKSGTLILHVV